jgi:GcrA cell cycle regulator
MRTQRTYRLRGVVSWTPDKVETLRQDWLKGLETPQIARKLGVSEDAIYGKRRRLQLPERPKSRWRDGRFR